MKPTTIFFYATEGKEAAALAYAERKEFRTGYSRDATAFDGEIEPCTSVIIMPSVNRHHRAKIMAAYGDRVAEDVEPPAVPQTLQGDIQAHDEIAREPARRGPGRPRGLA